MARARTVLTADAQPPKPPKPKATKARANLADGWTPRPGTEYRARPLGGPAEARRSVYVSTMLEAVDAASAFAFDGVEAIVEVAIYGGYRAATITERTTTA